MATILSFLEIERFGIVGEHIGATEKRMKEILEKVEGGTLFIDEAYSLVQGDGDSFGKEAVDTLVAEMENKRKNLVIIFAGYTTDFGNARGVRNMVEDIKRKQNVRVAALLIEGAEAVSDEQLLTIEKEDVI